MKQRCPVTKEKQEEFIRRVQQLMEVFPHDRVINIDETNRRVVTGGFWTWAGPGSEAISSIIDETEKKGITVITGIEASGAKLPLTVVGNGKTQRCLVALNHPPGVWSVTSPTRCSTSDVVCNYQRLLRQHLYPTGPLIVLLDTFAAHRAMITKAVAEEWGIDLISIPPGCIDALQPLNRRVFGILKAYALQLWRIYDQETHGEKATCSMTANNLLVGSDHQGVHRWRLEYILNRMRRRCIG
jgi:hypothetical protein